ncbi:C45 family autoproteolytic acyltransferase/hydolase [Halostreptopolyspora alba]|uniref:Peptidase C45 n=1 Tax=Halostreptopolyspora alba TaxID=2487137 RepID=A0A3N0EHY7_9ACTN|nr:peptidase C45 [Nocardiopsaceae bacterium YIM 96095]
MTGAAVVPHLVLTGTHEEIGHAHGSQLATRLRAFVADGRARLDHLMDPPPGDLDATLDSYAAAIRDQTPGLAVEMDALATGAGITPRAAVLLQARRELLGYQRVPSLGDCTTYARSGASSSTPVLAQTVDLNGDLEDQIAVLDIRRADSGRRTLTLSFGGQLGYLGINDSGLAVGINLVLAGDWGPGLPMYLAVRHLLDHASSVDEAVDELRGLEVASSRALMLCDQSTTAVVEIPRPGPASGCAVRRDVESVHTNHFLDPELSPLDELNVFARNSSSRRLTSCRERLDLLDFDASREQHLALLSDPPINVAPNGDIRTERTVAAVALFPELGELHLRAGDPSTAATRTYTLDPAPLGSHTGG